MYFDYIIHFLNFIAGYADFYQKSTHESLFLLSWKLSLTKNTPCIVLMKQMQGVQGYIIRYSLMVIHPQGQFFTHSPQRVHLVSSILAKPFST